MKTLIILAGIVFIALFTAAVGRLSSGEDTWLCQDGQWTKHGHPAAEMPPEPCGG